MGEGEGEREEGSRACLVGRVILDGDRECCGLPSRDGPSASLRSRARDLPAEKEEEEEEEDDVDAAGMLSCLDSFTAVLVLETDATVVAVMETVARGAVIVAAKGACEATAARSVSTSTSTSTPRAMSARSASTSPSMSRSSSLDVCREVRRDGPC